MRRLCRVFACWVSRGTFQNCLSHPSYPLRLQVPVVTSAGVACPGCSEPFKQASIHAQLETQLRQQIANYYAGWTVCEDATCGHRTRAMSVYGKRCLNPACAARGPVSYEVCRVVSIGGPKDANALWIFSIPT
jgi:hypothetical protein